MSKKYKELRKKEDRSYRQPHQDFHHFLYCRKEWSYGYYHLLRCQPYMGKYLPMETLHKEIHDLLAHVPLPSQEDCRFAYTELLRMEDAGLIDTKFDTAERRLSVLIDIFERIDAERETIMALKTERFIISCYYAP